MVALHSGVHRCGKLNAKDQKWAQSRVREGTAREPGLAEAAENGKGT